MSLLKNFEKRVYQPGGWAQVLGYDPNRIPTNAEAAYLSGSYGVTSTNALRHWAVWACARTVSEAISRLPVDLMNGSGASAKPTEPLPLILRQPSAYATKTQWVGQVAMSLLLSGNAYGLIASRDYYGYPTQITLVGPGEIRAELDDEGRKVYKNARGTLVPNDQVWHLPGLMWPGEVAGLDPVTYFARTITLGLEAEKFGADYFLNGAHPTAVASSDLEINETQAATIKQRIKAAVAGRDIAVLGAGLRLNPWQASPDDAQLLDMIRMNATMVCAIYGVPSTKINVGMGDGKAVTYANREQNAQEFLQDAVDPWLTRLEEAMSAWFPRGQFVKFNTGAFLKSDLKTRFDAYFVATGGKQWMLPSEARALENWPPVAGIDDQEQPTDGTDDNNADGQS